MRAITHKPMGVINSTGYVLAGTDAPVGEDVAFEVVQNITSNGKPYIYEGYTFVAIGTRNLLEYVIYIQGVEPTDMKICAMLAVSFASLQMHCGDRYDKSSYLKNVLLGNILPGDVFYRLKELQINDDAKRVVYVIQLPEHVDAPVAQILHAMFVEPDFVITIDSRVFSVIQASNYPLTREVIRRTAQSILDAVNSELMTQVYIGVGAPVDSITEIARSYSEAALALEIGRVFNDADYILSYDALGVGRLLYQLPSKLCELFMSEIFKKEGLEALDEETIQTIYKFFENNLNVSETSRQLFVHRNTLVYRLDKIERLTGLDLRRFDDAGGFKIAMMVNKYLERNPAKF
jgi:carbohydrate diacid regulator